MNLGLALMTLGVGEVQAKWGWNAVGFLYMPPPPQNYFFDSFSLRTSFTAVGIVSFLTAIGANLVDWHNKGRLNMSKSQLHHMALLEATIPLAVSADEQTLRPSRSVY